MLSQSLSCESLRTSGARSVPKARSLVGSMDTASPQAPTVFPGPSRLRDAGTISSLALLGRLANLHGRVRSSTCL